MNIGYARAIFDNINSDKYSENEKTLAIYTVMNMETHNSVTKDSMLKVIRWVKDNYVSERDFEVQREVFYMLYERLNEGEQE